MSDRAQLARCPRCQHFGLVAERQGIRVALDVAPVDAVGYGKAVASGPLTGLYWVENTSGRGSRVVSRYSGTPRPSWGPGGAQTGSQRLHAEHSCGAPARDMVIMPVSSGKGSAPATPGAPGAGNLLHDALAAVAQDQASRSPAPTATRHPSDHAVRCHDCRRLIDQQNEIFTGIFHERWEWAVHLECP